MTIDVADLRELLEFKAQDAEAVDAEDDFARGWVPLSLKEAAALLDAYEERDRLRAALNEQGFLQKKADGSMFWHAHDCPASFDFAQCNYRCRVARAALEGRE